jgi:ClpP class serine protease
VYQLNRWQPVAMLPEASERLQLAISKPAPAIHSQLAYPDRGQAAVATVEGVIWPGMLAELRRYTQSVADDARVAEVVFRVNSPGGLVEGVPETFEYVQRLASKKRVVVLAEGYFASAAYHVFCGATEIYASPSCVVGSLGTISVLIDDSEATTKAGYRVVPVTTGAAKMTGLPGVPVTEEDIARVRRRIEESTALFRRNVASSRRMTASQLEAAFADADVYHAAEAAARGYINGVMIPEDYIAKSEKAFYGRQFINLEGEAAEEKFRALCEQRGGELYEDEHEESVRRDFPTLAKRTDDHGMQSRLSWSRR